ncbi:MAG: hypothetical protein HRT36_07035 [Alphaproteobacteria bacterium]|nr:hypothetical protein [Alphaproteobacteria bacterium]
MCCKGDPAAVAKFVLFADQHIDGHCPLPRDKELNSYIVVGIRTEREATIAEKGLEKLRKGMRPGVDLRRLGVAPQCFAADLYRQKTIR